MRIPGADDPVGATEIARLLGVKPATVAMWQDKSRNVLPPADWPEVGGRPAWRWGRILAWAEETGRVKPRLRIGEWVELADGVWRPILEVACATVGQRRGSSACRVPLICQAVDRDSGPVHIATVFGLRSDEGHTVEWEAVAPETAGLAGGSLLYRESSGFPAGTEVGAARDAVSAVSRVVEDRMGVAPRFEPLIAPRPGKWMKGGPPLA